MRPNDLECDADAQTPFSAANRIYDVNWDNTIISNNGLAPCIPRSPATTVLTLEIRHVVILNAEFQQPRSLHSKQIL